MVPPDATDDSQEKEERVVYVEKERRAPIVVTLGFIFAVLMPLIGGIFGMFALGRGDRRGWYVIVASIVMFFLFVILIAASAGSA